MSVTAMSGKRVRQVFKSAQVAHLWAHQAQDSARTTSGNCYFSGDTIYSYGSHFPMARHVKGTSGRGAVLLTSRTYSPTTAGHLCDVRRAIPPHLTVFRVEDVLGKPAAHLATIPAEIDRLILELGRRRNKDDAFRELNLCIENANRFAEFFGLRKRFALPDGFDVDKAKEMARQSAERAERMKRAAAAREERQRIAHAEFTAERLAAWKRGEPVTMRFYGPEDFLRVSPSDAAAIETSRGAEFPVAHAPHLLAAVRSGIPYHHNGHSIHAGHFRVDDIDALGNVRAGCHYVTRQEIERLAAQLGL